MIGEIEGVSEGQIFEDRQALHDAGVQRGTQGGIGGGGESVVLSGGYVDDRDEGDVVIYTGAGGRDPNTGLQYSDQQLVRGNKQLAQHFNEGNPIRVCRGSQLDSAYAPESGYRYDGLYRIDDFWHETGQDGYRIYRFRLIKIVPGELLTAQMPAASDADTYLAATEGNAEPRKTTVYTTRVIRNSAVANHVKKLHRHRCQISGEILETPVGPYAEGCHIKPVGSPHDGPDTVENLLCLSPNMHVLFDKGAIAIADDMTLIGIEGDLQSHPEHEPSLKYIQYHREHIYNGGG